MNKPESGSESTYSSCKRQENGDAATETDRPLKKARFAWQVKGKYHLKNDITDNKSAISTLDGSNAGPSLENESECKEMISNVKPNLETLGDLLEQDLCTLDSMTKSDQQLLPNINLSREKLPYPRYIHSSIHINQSTSESVNVNNESQCNLNSKNELEDHCIASWQARQMTKCLIDNTINSLIDSLMRGPLLTGIDDDRFTVFGAPEPFQDLTNDDSIENEGILMAISAHGLQNTSSSSDYSTDNTTNISYSSKDTFLSPPSSPHTEDILDSNISFKGSQNSFSKKLDMSFSYTDEIKPRNNVPTSQELSSFSYRSYSDADNIQKNQLEYDTDNNNYSDNETNSHYDFLDTAVSFAIQYKGLTSYGTDYG